MDGRVQINTQKARKYEYSVICASGKDIPKEIRKCEDVIEACMAARACKAFPYNADYAAVLRIDGSLTKVYWENASGQKGTDLLPDDIDFPVAEKYIHTKE